MKRFKKLRNVTNAVFHKRNIIIMSARSTSHVSMSGKTQFLMVIGIIGLISAGSFSTGKYMAAQKVINEQGETIKSVANSRIESNYSYGVPTLSAQTMDVVTSAEAEPIAPITDPSYAFSGLDESKLIARISSQEKRIKELKKFNNDLVNAVRVTAGSEIKDLENVIRQTGLSPELMKRQAQQENKVRKKPLTASASADGNGGQGGPYIPENWDDSMRAFIEDLDKSADQIYVLRQILKVMPLAKPIQGASRESPFGRRVDPFNRRIAFHSGLDLASSSKPQIVAASSGKVSFSGWSGGYGNMVEIQHGLGISTRYGHMSKIMVKEGDVVTEGQLIGIQGSTGRSTGPHLHYEVRFNDRPINPAPFLNAGSKYVSKK